MFLLLQTIQRLNLLLVKHVYTIILICVLINVFLMYFQLSLSAGEGITY